MMMMYKEFCQLAQEMLEKKFKDGTRVRLCERYKNNGGFKEALCVLEKKSNVSPVLYLREYYEAFEAGMSMDEVVEKLLVEYKEKRCAVYMEAEEYMGFKKVEPKIAYKLVNYDRNKALLAQAPHRRYLDLAVVYYFLVDDPVIGHGTVVIDNHLLEAWNVTEETLYEIAQENTERLLGAEITPMNEVVRDLIYNDLLEERKKNPDDEELQDEVIEAIIESLVGNLHLDEPKDMYVYSNDNKYYGAAVLLNEGSLEKFASEKGGFFIIPSSIHEVILIPEGAVPEGGELKGLLKEVNGAMEDETEYLSDHIYYYDKDRKCVEVRK